MDEAYFSTETNFLTKTCKEEINAAGLFVLLVWLFILMQYTGTHIHTCAHCTRVHACVHTYRHPHTPACSHMHTRARTHVCAHRASYTQTHKCTRACTHIHSHVHTHSHTHSLLCTDGNLKKFTFWNLKDSDHSSMRLDSSHVPYAQKLLLLLLLLRCEIYFYFI